MNYGNELPEPVRRNALRLLAPYTLLHAGDTGKPGYRHIAAGGTVAAGSSAPGGSTAAVYCRPLGQSPAPPNKKRLDCRHAALLVVA